MLDAQLDAARATVTCESGLGQGEGSGASGRTCDGAGCGVPYHCLQEGRHLPQAVVVGEVTGECRERLWESHRRLWLTSCRGAFSNGVR